MRRNTAQSNIRHRCAARFCSRRKTREPVGELAARRTRRRTSATHIHAGVGSSQSHRRHDDRRHRAPDDADDPVEANDRMHAAVGRRLRFCIPGIVSSARSAAAMPSVGSDCRRLPHRRLPHASHARATPPDTPPLRCSSSTTTRTTARSSPRGSPSSATPTSTMATGGTRSARSDRAQVRSISCCST